MITVDSFSYTLHKPLKVKSKHDIFEHKPLVSNLTFDLDQTVPQFK